MYLASICRMDDDFRSYPISYIVQPSHPFNVNTPRPPGLSTLHAALELRINSPGAKQAVLRLESDRGLCAADKVLKVNQAVRIKGSGKILVKVPTLEEPVLVVFSGVEEWVVGGTYLEGGWICKS